MRKLIPYMIVWLLLQSCNPKNVPVFTHLRFEFEVPNDWEDQTSLLDYDAFFASPPKSGDDTKASITVELKFRDAISFEAYHERDLSEQQEKFDWFELDSSGTTKKGKYDGYWYSCSFGYVDGEFDFAVKKYFYDLDDLVLILSGTSTPNSMADYEGVFDTMVQSLRIKK